MLQSNLPELTERQRRELEYHRWRATNFESLLVKPLPYGPIQQPPGRPESSYWQMFSYLLSHRLEGRNVLVVGCGFGQDTVLIAKAGAKCWACDLSADSVSIAARLARREQADVIFDVMAAEHLTYPASFFDVVFARDILHHVEIPTTMNELVRVSKPGALFVMSEVYTHSWLERIRRRPLIDKVIYPRLRDFIYPQGVYITEDERKLSEGDVARIKSFCSQVEKEQYFALFVGRLTPIKWRFLNILDYIALRMLGPASSFVGGRVLLIGHLKC